MALQDDVRTHDAILWRAGDPDAFGDPTYSDPEDLKVWWKDDAVEFLDANGTRVISNAVIIVGEELKTGDLLKRGTVADDVEPGIDPPEQSKTYPVRRYTEVEDTLGSLGILRRVYL